jgi:nucleoside-diphosphate-sugar epimerase
MNNATYAANAVKAAKQMGCRRFVNAGTIEESYVEAYMGSPRDVPYRSTQTNYSLAKIAARDMCRIVSYLEKIDYIHTRLSVPLDLDLTVGNYIAATLRRIRNGEPYDPPVSDKWYDIISTRQAAMAYRRIGEDGKNKADYVIGSGHPMTLRRFFHAFSTLATAASEGTPEHEDAVDPGMFANDTLVVDTGFRPTAFLRDFQQEQGRFA